MAEEKYESTSRRLEDFRNFHPGSLLELEWDRGNGPLSGHYIFSGFDEHDKPILKDFHTGTVLDLRVLNNYFIIKPIK